MAITDNNFNAQELQAALAANPALAAELKTFGTAAGYQIRTSDEETEFLKNHETTIVNRKTSEIGAAIEKDVLDVFGEPKKENEKYHDYVKRAIKSSKEGLSAMKTELEALKAAGGSTSEADKQRITALENAIATEKESLGSKITEKDKLIHELKTGIVIEKSLSPLRAKYKTGIPESVLSTFENNVVSKISSSMKEIDGNMVIVDKDGNAVLDPATYKAISVSAFLENELKEVLDEGRQQGGAGSGKEGQQQQHQQTIDGVKKDESGAIVEVESVPATVKSKVQLTEYLLSIGVTSGSKASIQAFEKFGKTLPLK